MSCGIFNCGNARLDLLNSNGHFEADIPSGDKLFCVMGMIIPVALQRSFIARMNNCHTQGSRMLFSRVSQAFGVKFQNTG